MRKIAPNAIKEIQNAIEVIKINFRCHSESLEFKIFNKRPIKTRVLFIQ